MKVQDIELPLQNIRESKFSVLVYPVSLAVLGALIGLDIYIFLIYIQPGYHEIHWFGPANQPVMSEYGLRKFLLLKDAVFPSLCFFIGIALFFSGIACSLRSCLKFNSEKRDSGRVILSYAFIVLGMMDIAVITWYLGWLEPQWFSTITHIMPDGTEATLYRDPAWVRSLIVWKAISYLLGLAVFGLGLVQLVKSRKSQF